MPAWRRPGYAEIRPNDRVGWSRDSRRTYASPLAHGNIITTQHCASGWDPHDMFNLPPSKFTRITRIISAIATIRTAYVASINQP